MSINGMDRSQLIRGYAGRMRDLLNERDECNRLIRDLHVEIRKETGIPRDDFIAAMRLQRLAADNRERTVANIRDVLTALGSVSPILAPPSAAPSLAEPTLLDRVKAVALEKKGTSIEIAERMGIGVNNVAPQLSRLAKIGVIAHVGKEWGDPGAFS